mmetsp:Transcript_15667/g.27215  ORF Transcript_15667/g.27215 Transcript_15667/m.27215 type:complete len:219 (+) Transcript_15667:165-821(+)
MYHRIQRNNAVDVTGQFPFDFHCPVGSGADEAVIFLFVCVRNAVLGSSFALILKTTILCIFFAFVTDTRVRTGKGVCGVLAVLTMLVFGIPLFFLYAKHGIPSQDPSTAFGGSGGRINKMFNPSRTKHLRRNLFFAYAFLDGAKLFLEFCILALLVPCFGGVSLDHAHRHRLIPGDLLPLVLLIQVRCLIAVVAIFDRHCSCHRMQNKINLRNSSKLR